MKRFGTWAPAIVFCAAFCGVLFLSNPVNAAPCTFASTEATNSFNTAANWSCGHVPVAADNFTVPAATTTSMVSGPLIVTAGLISGTLNIGSQSLTISNSLTVNSGGVATSTSGTLILSVNATTTNSGSIGTNSGNFLFGGNIQNNGMFDISAGNVTSTATSTFTNAGTINGGTGSLAIGYGFVDAGGTFNAQNGTVRTFHDGHLWVTNNASFNSVSKIDITSNTAIATTTVGTFPIGAAFGGGYVWVGNFSTNNVSKIDPITNFVVATTTVGTGPRGIAFDGTSIWVANATTNNVSKINITTNTVVATTVVGSAPRGVAFDGANIWVVNSGTNNVSKIDITTNAVVATTTVGSGPQHLAFDGSHMWVVNNNSSNISKIDITTNAVVATTTAGTGPFGIAYGNGYIWVSNGTSNDVSKIDITTGAHVATTTIGASTQPQDIVFDGNSIWVVNANSAALTVSKIDTTTNLVVATTTKLGGTPREIVYGGSIDPTNIALPGYVYNNLQVFNNHTDTVSFSASSTVLGALSLSGIGKLSAGTLTINVLGAGTVESGTTVTSTSGGFRFSSAVTSTGSIGSNSGNLLFSSTLQNNGTLDIGSGTATSTGALTNAAGATIHGRSGTLDVASDFTNSGTFNSQSGTVRVIGATAQSIPGVIYNNLTSMKTGGTVTLAASSTVLGSFNVTGNGGTLSSAANDFSVVGPTAIVFAAVVTSTSGVLTFAGAATSTGSIGSSSGNILFGSTLQNNGTLQVSTGVVTSTGALTNAISGTINGNGGTLALRAGWTNNGTFNAKSGTVRFAGTAAQTVPPLSYYNLVIRTTGGDAGIVATTTIGGTTQVDSGSTFAVSTSTVTAVGLITNVGTITEGTGGKIIHAAESTKLTDSSGTEASSYSTATGAPAPVVYVTVQDSNRNLLGSTIETMTVTVTLDATAGSDSETMTLTETSVSSGIFRNLAALAIIPATAMSTPENGQFELVATGIGTSTYTDNQDASDIGTDTIIFSKAAVSTDSGSSGGGGGGGGAATDPNTSGIQPSGFVPTPSGTGSQTDIPGEFVDPNDLPLLLPTYSLTANPALHTACLSLVRSDAKSFGLTLTSAQETAMCNFIVYGISHATIKFGSGERRAILRDYFDTMRRSDVVWSDIQRMATGRIMIVRNLPEEQKRVAQVLSVFVKIFGHNPNFLDAKENLSWNTMQYRLRFPRNLTLEMMGIQRYQAAFFKNPVTPFEWSVVRVLGYVR